MIIDFKMRFKSICFCLKTAEVSWTSVMLNNNHNILLKIGIGVTSKLHFSDRCQKVWPMAFPQSALIEKICS